MHFEEQMFKIPDGLNTINKPFLTRWDICIKEPMGSLAQMNS